MNWWHRWMEMDERDGTALALVVGCSIIALVLLIFIAVAS